MTNVLCGLLFGLFSSFFVYSGEALITIEEYGGVDLQCINDFDYSISRLSDSDKSLIDQLSFVFVTYRHGKRLGNDPFENIFPNHEFTLECNVKKVLSAVDANGDSSQYKLKLNYVENEQIYDNSNCANTQVADFMPDEMIATGNIIANRYFDNNNGDTGINSNNNDQFNSMYRSSDYIHSAAIEVNRILFSHAYLLQGILGDSTNDNSEFINIDIHDPNHDIWRSDLNDNCRTTSGSEYTAWQSRYSAATLNSQVRSDYVATDEIQALIDSFESEGGAWINNNVANTLAMHYCGGIDIPLSIDLWDELMEYGRTYDKLFDESDNGQYLNKCVTHQYSRTAYKKILQEMNNALNDESAPKMYITASQGGRLRNLLWGLDMYPTRKTMQQNEVVTFEVYKANSNDDGIEYYFRWTRNGEFLAFPSCNDFYDENNTELCDLNVLLNDEYGFSDALTLAEYDNVCLTMVSDCVCGLCDDDE